MAKFAPVAPLALLNVLTRRQLIGDYHLLLAHEILADPDGWKTWAGNLREVLWPMKPTLIMDSSVIELGHPLPTDDIIKAARIIEATVIVLPDIIGDSLATIKYISELETSNAFRQNTYGFEFMFVPQGRSLREYIASIEFISRRDWVTWIGLPRDALKFDGINSREQLIFPCKVMCPSKKIHLLGFSDDVMDDFMCCAHAQVFGMDSAVPIRAGQRDIQFQLSNSDYGKRGDYFKETMLKHQTVWNLKYTRQLLDNMGV
jgi:hypothetical protein